MELCGQVYRTRVAARDKNPVWNMSLIFDVFQEQHPHHHNQNHQSSDGEENDDHPYLVVKLFHRSSAVAKTLLGSCVVNELLSLIAPTVVWVPIQAERFSPVKQENQFCLFAKKKKKKNHQSSLVRSEPWIRWQSCS